MSNHTQEPWNTNGDPIVFDATGVVAFTDTRTNLDKVNKANARRIVACVNACAGISTEALEDSCQPALSAWKLQKEIIEQQRDELLTVLKKIVPLAEFACSEQSPPYADEHLVESAKEIIAKVEAA